MNGVKMTDGDRSSIATAPKGRLRNTLGEPVMRNGLLIATTTVVTSLLGLAFWAVAARFSTPAEVGRASVAITMLTLIANIAGLNLAGSFSYLLPRLRASRRRFVLMSYVLTCSIAVVLAVVFVVFALIPTSPLHELVTDPLSVLVLVIAAPVFVLFTIQNGVLVGMRRATWLLAENTVFSVLKLAGLVLLLAIGTAHAISHSWIAATVVIVPVMSALIFTRLLRRGEREPDVELISPTVVRRFVGLQYVSSLFGQTYLNALPLVVTLLVGSTAEAYFYLPWTIAITVDLISHALGSSLTVEGASDPSQLSRHVRTVGLRLGALLGAGGLIGVVFAPQFLLLYGEDYSSQGALLLRLLILGALIRAVVVVTQGATRALGLTRVTLVTEALTCVLMLTTSVLLLPGLGIDAIGWCWLATNVVVAAVCVPSLVRIARSLPARAEVGGLTRSD